MLARIDIRIENGPARFSLQFPLQRARRSRAIHVGGSFAQAMLAAQQQTRAHHVSFAVLQAAQGYDLIPLEINADSEPPVVDQLVTGLGGAGVQSARMTSVDASLLGVAGAQHLYDLRQDRVASLV